ncbi:class I SAM-dependent methyltransferase [Pseudonocardia asaccharolytica]|uniref:SAM-dependent methyltransferase n=1 Tax=Pseudonocardia asaccharolytica DSM 44247 = NBRC 16224 TaxID=1123024 RepID=A0A511D3Y0_9PSEU|nr:class I SAM-dependent methyltransferase [Pseudonocardia asaccharolytica]GEL19502.1 SAM-dependent methyltransferase [Pseudonocardia asaccharolytica DSM 44247 = NBRC 16224]
MDENRLMEFVHKAVADVGLMGNAALVALGDRLGLFTAMADAGPLTAAELAARTDTHERYVREWLASQAANGYLTYEGDGRYTLPAEHAVALTDETSPVCVIGAYQLALATVQSTYRLAEAFRTGAGIGWGDHHPELYPGCERFFAPSYRNHLVTSWIPALDGVEDRLRDGATVADIGCGHGASTLVMAEAYPASRFVGFDPHPDSVTAARKRAADAGLASRVRFEIATAADFPGTYDLVTFFDCLHDMGDPTGAGRHSRAALNPGGTAMIVEPRAADRIEDNLNPVSATYYAFSTQLCTPNSLAQDGGSALGAQAGEARLRQVLTEAGFRTVQRVAETPFNMVLQARP